MAKMIPDTKTIEGKRYHRIPGRFTEKAADGAKSLYTQQGYRVRVVKVTGLGGYCVYINGLGYK
jgi:hypothetical protein